MPKLSREEMLRVIQDGGSVLIDNVVVAHPAHLPSEADLAKGDKAASEAVKKHLTGEMARIAGEMAKLEQDDARRARTSQHVVDKDGQPVGDGGAHTVNPLPLDEEGTPISPAEQAAATEEAEETTKPNGGKGAAEKK